MLLDTLDAWHSLFAGQGWLDEKAKELWEQHVASLPGYKAPEEIGEELTGTERKKKREANRERLRAAAAALAGNSLLCMKLHEAWATRWRKDDAAWFKRLRWLRDWILPRGNREDDPSIRHVGGLSLDRIATIKSLYQVQKAFHMRPEPEDLRKNIPAKGQDDLRDFGKGILDTMERLRENRVKQLASRIAEAALGIGVEREKTGKKDLARPQERIGDSRFAPCHAVVIENLTHYRPEETRTRRENRQLMSWSSSKVKKYLAEACQLNGLHLREVQAGYTSRQDSRTGAPGIRCQDVPVTEFMQSPFWRKQVALAEKKVAEGKGDARERLLCDLNAKWKGKAEPEWKRAGAVRIPLKGGEIFVSAGPCVCCEHGKHGGPSGLQADLNAAANIGLKALLDPDWPGRWWYVPCESATHKPDKDKVKGSAAIHPDEPLAAASAESADGTGRKGGKTKGKATARDVVNLWRDVSSRPISARDGPWEVYSAYQNQVQARVVKLLRRSAGLAPE